MKRLFLSLLFSSMALGAANAQANTQADTTRVLTLGDFYAYLEAYHPILKQAELYRELGRGQRKEAYAGVFDPSVSGYWDKKQFEGKDYYDDFSVKGKVPTPVGVDLIGGYEVASGQFLSAERTMPDRGLAYMGVGVPIGGELIYNRRWNTMRQARLLPQMAEADRRKLATKLYLNATKAYLNWQTAYQLFLNAARGIDFADTSLNITKQMYRRGAMARIDTTESFLALQQRKSSYEVARYELKAARLQLSAFLWTPAGQPMPMDENLIPTPIPDSLPAVSPGVRDSLLAVSDSLNPKLQKLSLKQQQLTYESRYRLWGTLPSVTFEYKPLLSVAEPQWDPAFNGENYKFGLSFYIPLTRMKSRGKLQQVRAKLAQTEFELQQYGLSLERNIMAGYTTVNGLRRAWRQQQQTVRAANEMLIGERAKFRAGTGELFKVLYRELVVLKEQANLAKLTKAYYKARAEMYWQAGAFPPLR